jgi:hypothetical protein
VQTGIQHKRANRLGKNPALVSAKGYEVGFVVDLKMGKLSAIKRLRHLQISTKIMWGQPPPAVRRSEAPLFFLIVVGKMSGFGGAVRIVRVHSQVGNLAAAGTGELSLARTAEGGCPHMS